MESFCNEIKDKVCVKYDSEEIQDITKAVDILMNRFVDELKIKYPDIKIGKLFLCGSMAEKTRVFLYRNDIEFDYLAVLKSWPGCGDFVFEHFSEGQMKVKYKRDARQSVSDEYVDLDPEMKVTFSSIFDKCIYAECERNLCAIRFSNANEQFMRNIKGCRFCSVDMKTGTLQYINTLSFDSKIDKYKLVWTSKWKSVEGSSLSVSEEDIVKQDIFKHTAIDDDITFPIATYLNQYHNCFPQQSNWKINNALEVNVEIDFHPAIELDVTKVHWNQRIIHLKIRNPLRYYHVANLVLPNSYHYVLRFLINLLEEQKLLHFVFKLLYRRLAFKKGSSLHKNEKYLLFPKRGLDDQYNSSWRISTCQTELDIIHNTSQEHRLAYCVLKFLIEVLPDILRRVDSFCVLPRIWPYEAKIAVIRHIRSCKTPRIGTHVCLLNIMHDIALCRDAGAMEHPILHVNLYETLPKRDFENEKAGEVISFKALLLIIAYQRKEYTVTDLINDVVSLNSIWKPISVRYQYQPTQEHKTKDALCKLKKLVQNRKEQSARSVLLKMILSQLRENQIQNIQENVIRNNLNDLAVVEQLSEISDAVEFRNIDRCTCINLKRNCLIL